ncbi:MAG: transcription termination/antitermination protein NusG [Proteobacteria bacterium]|jgi:transcriptional antiterminator NusG|nr:transcription termination/antitermination protein NusG [Pseudomonadota bacterium]
MSEQVQAEARVLALGDTPDFKWYVAHVLSGFENRVTKTLKERIVNHNMTEYFAEILVPEESVTANVNGKKRSMKKKFFPGYVLIKMIMNDKTWHLVKDTDKITGFIGGTKEKPMPISDEEAATLTNSMTEGFKRSRSVANFSEGDSVKVIEGPFASFVGVVEAISEKGKVKVNVSIFGRPTPVELEFGQVEKVN